MEDVRIKEVKPIGVPVVRLWLKGKRDYRDVNLAGWIATGGERLEALHGMNVFQGVTVGDYGAAITWDRGEGDLSIDAIHLMKLWEEQQHFSNEEIRAWQTAVKLSNSEAADFLGVSVSTWNTYRVEAKIPQAVAIACRATLRDPIVLQAHLRPRFAGRPRKDQGATS